MARVHLFADESGNLDFSGKGSRYFILTSITVADFRIGDHLLTLRRDMGWRDIPLSDALHATTDAQSVRDEVFAMLADHEFRVDATVLEKANAHLHLRQDEVRFYRTAWYLHMKYIAPRIVRPDDELFVVGASLGSRKQRDLFRDAISDVVWQTTRTTIFKTAAWAAACEPCLQVADYCSWAIQRKWERDDLRSYVLIRDKIATEFQAF